MSFQEMVMTMSQPQAPGFGAHQVAEVTRYQWLWDGCLGFVSALGRRGQARREDPVFLRQTSLFRVLCILLSIPLQDSGPSLSLRTPSPMMLVSEDRFLPVITPFL